MRSSLAQYHESGRVVRSPARRKCQASTVTRAVITLALGRPEYIRMDKDLALSLRRYSSGLPYGLPVEPVIVGFVNRQFHPAYYWERASLRFHDLGGIPRLLARPGAALISLRERFLAWRRQAPGRQAGA